MYLIPTDYHAQIRPEQLEKITESNNTLLLDAQNKAMSQARSRLAGRYDIPAEYARTGTTRNAELVMCLVDMTLYHLHARIAPGQVPALRSERYNDALEWLKNVGAGDWVADLPPLGDADGDGTDDGNVVQGGSRPPRNPYF